MQYWEKSIRNLHTWKNQSKPGKLPVTQGNLTGMNCTNVILKRKKIEMTIEKKYDPQKLKKNLHDTYLMSLIFFYYSKIYLLPFSLLTIKLP